MSLFADEDWRLLRIGSFRLRITYADGRYIAAVHKLHERPTSEKTLQAVIASAKAMIVRCLDAPPELAPDLRVALELDESASKHFTEAGE